MAARSDATRDRRRQILEAALACFNEVGYAKTTIALIRERAGRFEHLEFYGHLRDPVLRRAKEI